LDSFTEEQIRSLVRQVFLPGRTKATQQVVFSAVDSDTDIGSLCMQVGLALSSQVSGSTCLVEARPNCPGLEQTIENNGLDLVAGQESSRESSRRLSNQLWLIPRRVFVAENENGWSGPWLRERLSELRQTFAYTILCCPPAASCGEAAMLASLCDGIVLVLQANLHPAGHGSDGEGKTALLQCAFVGRGTQ
jgi:hypothetical protein